MKRVETVSIVYRHPRILLGVKKRKFGVGRYNGFGGGFDKRKGDKTVYDTNMRETQEEAEITLLNPKKIGRILFHFQTKEQDHDVNFFLARKYLGIPKETSEMTTEWFNIKNIPYNQMWTDDKYWLPIMLRGDRFLGEFLFDSNHDIVKPYRLDEYKDEASFEEALLREPDI